MITSDVYTTGFDEANGKTIDTADCPERPGRVVADGGERRCDECGLIVDEYRFDHGPAHYRFGDRSEKRERTGAPLTPARHDRGLSTAIGRGVDGYGNSLSASKRRRLGRLRTQHDRGRWRSKGERNLGHAFSEIARLVSALELPRSVREEASVLYRRAQAENLILGRSIEAIAAGSVYAACRCGGYTRAVEEFAAVSCCSVSTVRLGYRVLNVELGLEAVPFGPADLVPRLASACDASSAIEQRTLELASIAEEATLFGERKFRPDGPLEEWNRFGRRDRSGSPYQTFMSPLMDSMLESTTMDQTGRSTSEGYCRQCDDTVEIYLTVPWQADACSRCGGTDVEVER